jgi:predicted transcriptional regulator
MQREKNVKTLSTRPDQTMVHPNSDLLTLAASIVSAHVGHNEVGPREVPKLIRDVYETLATVASNGEPRVAAPARSPARAAAAVPTDDQLTCMECGMRMKMLKRHLLTVHSLTPEDYRSKYNLPDDTPMVTSNYAELRSQLAKASGLGKRSTGGKNGSRR